MNKEIADRWVKALRSGSYKQATGTLKDASGGFCCLGVLCDLAPEHVGGWSEREFVWEQPFDAEEDYDEYGYRNGLGETVTKSEGGECPAPVMAWAGMHGTTGEHRLRGFKSLVELNDDAKANFLDIADYIEVHHEFL